MKAMLSYPVSLETLLDLCRKLDPGCTWSFNGRKTAIYAIERFSDADETCLSYFDGEKPPASPICSGCVIVRPSLAESHSGPLTIISNYPRSLFIQVINILLEKNPLDITRSLAPLAKEVSEGITHIHPTAIVMPGAVIGTGCTIGAGAIIHPNVVLHDGVHVKSACVIGESGAAIVVDDHATLSQPHVGSVVIGPNCEIGAQSNIARGIFGSTQVGARCVIGNQSNIGHNVEIRDGVWIGASTTIGGFTKIGRFSNIGMGVVCKNGIQIGENCQVAMGSCVTKSIANDQSCFGNPAKVTMFRISAGPAKPFQNRGLNA